MGNGIELWATFTRSWTIKFYSVAHLRRYDHISTVDGGWKRIQNLEFHISDDARKRFCVLALWIYAIISYFFICVVLCGIAQAWSETGIPNSSFKCWNKFFTIFLGPLHSKWIAVDIRRTCISKHYLCSFHVGYYNVFRKMEFLRYVRRGFASRTFHWTDTSGGTEDMCLRIWHGKLRYFIWERAVTGWMCGKWEKLSLYLTCSPKNANARQTITKVTALPRTICWSLGRFSVWTRNGQTMQSFVQQSYIFHRHRKWAIHEDSLSKKSINVCGT